MSGAMRRAVKGFVPGNNTFTTLLLTSDGYGHGWFDWGRNPHYAAGGGLDSFADGNGNGAGTYACGPLLFNTTIEAICFVMRPPCLISARSLRSFWWLSWPGWRPV